MTSLYEVLKRSKTAPQLAPDMFTALWAKSITAGKTIELSWQVPLSFKANGEPLLDYLISGNTTQNGTPSPDNPLQPQGTGERTGNLFNPNSTRYHMGKATNNRIGSVSSGAMFYIKAEPNTAYTIKIRTTDSTFVRLYLSNAPIVENVGESYNVISESETTINPEVTISNTDYAYLWIQVGGAWYTEHGGESIMLNSGSTALPYEPFGVKIPISSANATTPVYLGEVQTTRKIKKWVLTGGDDENWSSTTIGTNDYIYRMELSDLPKSGVAPICTHYTGSTATRWVDIANYGVTTSIINSVAIRHSGLTGVSDWKAYLQQQYANGTPVTVWHILASETTGIVNEPLMKIGDYADTVSKEQAGVSIPTNNGSTTVDVDTELKPSEVYIKYHTR